MHLHSSRPSGQCMRTTMSAMVKRFLASATRILLTRSLHSLLMCLDMGQEYSAARCTPNQTGLLRVKSQKGHDRLLYQTDPMLAMHSLHCVGQHKTLIADLVRQQHFCIISLG